MGLKMTDSVDPLLVKLVAERMNLSTTETEALERGDISAVISSRFAGDPAMGPLLQLAQQEEVKAQQQRQSVRKNNPKTEKEAARMLRMMRRLQEELHAAQVVVNHVAEIFGACALCFGEDEDCEECEGHGAPGSRVPERKELLAWVKPALARLGLQVTPMQDTNPAKKPV